MADDAAKTLVEVRPLECPAPISLRREVMFALPVAVTVVLAMMPATIVIPVIRSFVASGWPGSEWIPYGFMAVNLLGACVFGPVLAVAADKTGKRRAFAATLALVDALMIVLVAAKPPLVVMLMLRFIQGAASVGAVSVLMGAARGRQQSAAATGLIGSAVVLSLVIGIPLGAVLGRVDPVMALLVGGGAGALAAVLAGVSMPTGVSSPLGARQVWATPGIRRPVLVIGLERFSVGTFAVTLQLHGFHVLGLPDGAVGRQLGVFLVAFAAGTLPATRLGERIGRWRLIALGAIGYAAMFFVIPFAGPTMLPVVLALGGASSAAIYGPGLSLVSRSVPSEARGSAMSLMNAAGTFGMFLGNVTAGSVATAVLAGGGSRQLAYGLVFAIAGLSQVASVGLASVAARRA